MGKPLFFLFLIFLSSFVSAQCAFYLLDVQSDYYTLPSQVFPGDSVSFSAGIENIADSCSVKQITASIVLNEKYFEVIKSTDEISGLNSNETKSAIFNFKVKDNAPPGTYKTPVTLRYTNGANVVEETFDLSIDVKECFSIDIENISYSSESVYAGEPLKIFADIKNSCSGAVRDVDVELKPVTNSTFNPFILLSSNLVQIGSVYPQKSKPISFTLKPIESAAPQIYVFELDANCFDCQKTFTDTISFEVLAKPDIIFSGIDFSNETRQNAKSIIPGDNFSFSVQMDNIGKEDAKAVKITLVTDKAIGGSKEEFVGNIDSDDSGAAIFDLIVLPAAIVGEHNATINVEYIDETGETQLISETYKFFVNQPPSNLGGLIFLLVLIIIVLILLYFIIKMVFRQLALRKAKLR